MNTLKRKLAAILSADVVGYSKLMTDDEEATVHTLKSYRKLIESLINEHRGRLVDSPGDNMLAEFASVVDALRCAWDIQSEIKSRNSDLPENRRMTFRIGVNLGDVIEEEGRIYGDGVNVAARLESLSEPGGISISGIVYNQVKNKLQFRYEDQGEQSVKNIDEPVQVYRVLMGSESTGKVAVKQKTASKWKRNIAVALVVFLLILTGAATVIWDTYWRIPDVASLTGQNEEFKLPEGPSIAVLPFDNMSGDPEQEYICDGLTENIITSLSYNPKLFVIARNSCFHFKGKSPKVQEVAKELGVQYVLEGSFQKAGDRVRINAQLIDAKTGHHLWAEKYDRELEDLFELQDDVSERIFTALAVKLTDGEAMKIRTKYPTSLEFNLKLMKTSSYINRFSPEGNILARQEAEQALALFPENPAPYEWIGWTYLLDTIFGIGESPINSLVQATKLAKSALDIDENNPGPYLLLGGVSLMRGNHEKAIALLKQAISLNPNFGNAYLSLGEIYTYAGEPEKGLDLIKKGISLNPIPPANYFSIMGLAYSLVGLYEEAIAALNKAIDREPDYIFAHINLVYAYSLSGQDEKARKEAAEVLRINPDLSLERDAERWPSFKNQETKKQIIDALRKAGLK